MNVKDNTIPWVTYSETIVFEPLYVTASKWIRSTTGIYLNILLVSCCWCQDWQLFVCRVRYLSNVKNVLIYYCMAVERRHSACTRPPVWMAVLRWIETGATSLMARRQRVALDSQRWYLAPTPHNKSRRSPTERPLATAVLQRPRARA